MTYIEDWRREEREYRAAVDALTDEQRAHWSLIGESHEWFDGESAIAYSTLNMWLERGLL